MKSGSFKERISKLNSFVYRIEDNDGEERLSKGLYRCVNNPDHVKKGALCQIELFDVCITCKKAATAKRQQREAEERSKQRLAAASQRRREKKISKRQEWFEKTGYTRFSSWDSILETGSALATCQNGHRVTVTMANFSTDLIPCKLCRPRKDGSGRVYDSVFDTLTKKGISITADSEERFENQFTRLFCVCKKGHRFESNYQALRTNKEPCTVCIDNAKPEVTVAQLKKAAAAQRKQKRVQSRIQTLADMDLEVCEGSLQTLRKDVTVRCKSHGHEQKLQLASVLNRTNSPLFTKTGCVYCRGGSFNGQNPNEPVNLYYLRVIYKGRLFYKIGITCGDIDYRYKHEVKHIEEVLLFKHFDRRILAWEVEQEALIKYAADRYYGRLRPFRKGNRELFTKDVLGLDSQYSNTMLG